MKLALKVIQPIGQDRVQSRPAGRGGGRFQGGEPGQFMVTARKSRILKIRDLFGGLPGIAGIQP